MGRQPAYAGRMLSDREAYDRLHAALIALGKGQAESEGPDNALRSARLFLSACQQVVVASEEGLTAGARDSDEFQNFSVRLPPEGAQALRQFMREHPDLSTQEALAYLIGGVLAQLGYWSPYE